MYNRAYSNDPSLFRPTILDIDLDALESNYCAIASFVQPALVMPVLKANAYGHGLIACARVLEACGAECLGVAFLDEAIALRESGIKMPIVALGGICGRQIEGFLKYDVEFCASSVMKLEAINAKAAELGKKAKVHIKIDTGMGRIGQKYSTADKIFDVILKCQHCEVRGVFSHFADSEIENLSYSYQQLKRFEECLKFFSKHGLKVPMRHIANSGGILQMKESHLDLVRPGLLLYGVSPLEFKEPLIPIKPVLSLSTEVVFFKVLEAGSPVSYGRTWTADKQTRVITIPVGYGDGYPRALSNCGEVLISGQRRKIIGRVCMDQFMVDISSEGTAYNGDEVVLIGKQGSEEISVMEISHLVNTDPRDVLLSLNIRLPRRFSYKGEVFYE